MGSIAELFGGNTTLTLQGLFLATVDIILGTIEWATAELLCETPLNGPIWAGLIGLGRMTEYCSI
jgi:hypothetical protein